MKMHLRFARSILLLVFLHASSIISAQITSIANGAWLNPSTWDCTCLPGTTAVVTIKHNVIMSTDWGLGVGGSITIDSGASFMENVPGKVFAQLGGVFVNNGTVNISNYAITAGQTVNNDSMRINRNLYIKGTGSFENYDVVADLDTLWNEASFKNYAEIAATILYNDGSFFNYGGMGFVEGLNEGVMVNSSFLASVLFWNDGDLQNDPGGSISALDFWNTSRCTNLAGASFNITGEFANGDSLLPLSGPIFANAGFVGVGQNFYNADSITGDGQFCIGEYSLNWGYIGGTIDICDQTGGGIDDNIGTIEPSVTTCSGGPCAMVVSIEDNEPTCSGDADGSIIIDVFGGSGSYSFEWNTDDTISSATGLQEGVYIILISDGFDTVYSVVELNTSAIYTIVSSTETSCDNENGTASVTAFEGSPPYKYVWGDLNAQSNATATGLAAGTYSVTISDIDSCFITEVITVLAKPGITVNTVVTPTTCLSHENGVIDITVTGGTPAFTYEWVPDVSNGSLASDIKVGDYTITITDADSCVVVNNVSVTALGGSDCEADWKIFSGITPNGDGVDDVWEIRGLSQFKPVTVDIFTNRGIVIWSSDDYNNEWGGTDQEGDELMPGVYYYIVTRQDEVHKGWVHIVR